MSDQTAEEKSRSSLRDLVRPSTLAGAVFLAIASSGAYDLLVKPGLTTFGQTVLNVVTFGSQTLKNAVYTSAASDPRPVSALLLLQFALMAVCGLAGFMVSVVHSRDSDERAESELRKESEKQPTLTELEVAQAVLKRLKRRRAQLGWVLTAMTIVSIVGFLVLLSVHSQSVAVWRVFNQDLAILSPKISSAQVLDLRAEFASMENAASFTRLNKRMHDLASTSGVTLKEFSTWE